jgi:hypothetical protein
MRVDVGFQDESIDFEVPEDHMVASWRGTVCLARSGRAAAIEGAPERPRVYRPLRQMDVPGDRVVIVLDVAILFVGKAESAQKSMEENGEVT